MKYLYERILFIDAEFFFFVRSRSSDSVLRTMSSSSSLKTRHNAATTPHSIVIITYASYNAAAGTRAYTRTCTTYRFPVSGLWYHRPYAGSDLIIQSFHNDCIISHGQYILYRCSVLCTNGLTPLKKCVDRFVRHYTIHSVDTRSRVRCTRDVGAG